MSAQGRKPGVQGRQALLGEMRKLVLPRTRAHLLGQRSHQNQSQAGGGIPEGPPHTWERERTTARPGPGAGLCPQRNLGRHPEYTGILDASHGAQ